MRKFQVCAFFTEHTWSFRRDPFKRRRTQCESVRIEILKREEKISWDFSAEARIVLTVLRRSNRLDHEVLSLPKACKLVLPTCHACRFAYVSIENFEWLVLGYIDAYFCT